MGQWLLQRRNIINFYVVAELFVTSLKFRHSRVSDANIPSRFFLVFALPLHLEHSYNDYKAQIKRIT